MTALTLLFLTASAFALDADTFETSGAVGAGGAGLQLVDPAVGWPGARYAGLILSYAHDPLVREVGGEVLPVVRTQLATRLIGGYSLGFARIDAELPVYLYSGAAGTVGSGPALGDLRVAAMIPVYRLEAAALSVGVLPSLVVPTGARADFTGGEGVGAGLVGAVRWDGVERLAVTGNLGFEGAPAGRLGDVEYGSALVFGAGAAYDALDRVRVGLELDARATVAGSSGGAARTPVEAHLWGAWGAARGVFLTAGVGTGLVAGLGTPDARVVIGGGWREPGKEPVFDADGDGLVDASDTCPVDPEDVDGVEDTDGCPDLDNDADGIPDAQDVCRNDAEDRDGFVDGDGCPDDDNDQDYVPDAADACPNAAGPAQTRGCPDGDADRVADADDACPTTPGPVELRGCPDADADGVPDQRDKCPNEPRDPAEDVTRSDGCPKRVVVTKEAIVIKDRIYFDTNKTTIKAQSHQLLDEIAGVLRANTDLTRIEVGGHTDNVGDEGKNLRLSDGRARAVVEYLVQKGGIDASRLTPVGYGETQPIDTNGTESGRATNRRVEFLIKGG